MEQERGALREAERRRERLHRALATVDASLHQESEQREAASKEADAAQTHLLAKLKVSHPVHYDSFLDTLAFQSEYFQGITL